MAELTPKEVSDLLDKLLADVAAEESSAPEKDAVGGPPPGAAPPKEPPRKDAVPMPSVGRPRKKKG